MKKYYTYAVLVAMVIAAFLTTIAIFAADQVYQTSINTKVNVTKVIGSYECVVGVTGGVTNIVAIRVNWSQSASDTNGNTYASSTGTYTLTRDQVWNAPVSAWRTGVTNAWDGQIDLFPARVLALWQNPNLLVQ